MKPLKHLILYYVATLTYRIGWKFRCWSWDLENKLRESERQLRSGE